MRGNQSPSASSGLRKSSAGSLDSFSRVMKTLNSAGLVSPRCSTSQKSGNRLQHTAADAIATHRAHVSAPLPKSIPHYEPTKCSFKKNGEVRAYAANTNQGLVRDYNEDRVSIILNIMKPAGRVDEPWPKCSFFGVYDGHGGAACADFLRDRLHQFITKAPAFPWNPKEALRVGFQEAERTFLSSATSKTSDSLTEKSGSCALVVLVVDNSCYIANVGDSRAIMSGDCGKRLFLLSKDHKPGTEEESRRISGAGGSIYQSQGWQYRATPAGLRKEATIGPVRVLPGRLSVSRSFGDAEAKIARFGGNPAVLIAVPEIRSFKIAQEHDFILLGSDGLFDKLTNKEAVSEVWNSLAQHREATVHKQCGVAVESVLRVALDKRSLDNITVVMVAFKGFKARYDREACN